MRFFLLLFSFVVFPYIHLSANEAEIFEIRAKTCEKSLEGESPSSTRVRAVDKAVFLSIKNLDILSNDKKNLSDHDLNVMIYRLVDDYTEDLSVKTIKSEEDKVCVETFGYISAQNIEKVRAEFQKAQQQNDDELVAKIAEDVKKEITLNPKSAENLALVYVADLAYYNGATSKKYAAFLKKDIEQNPYYYITDKKDLADYVIKPKVLKAKTDALDSTHKRLHMVLNLEISGLEDETVNVVQNRFVLFSTEENDQNVATRLLKKLLTQAGKDAVRKIEKKEQTKLEQNLLGRNLSE